MKLKSYPAYKDSGVPWLGKIPKHWDASRLGAVLQERGENNADGHVEQVLSVLRDVGVIPYEDKGNIGNKKSEDISRYKVVRPGDIVINCMNVIIGSVGLSRYTGCLSPVYYVLRTRHTSDRPDYFNNVFRLKPFQQSLVRIGNGILAHRMRIPMELLKCEVIPRPHQEEQDAIVRFLAHADHRVNRLIRAKQRLIELLNEQKQAIIHRAVTRGLDPNVRLKPSGIDWLGDVPEHWRVLRLRHLVSTIDQGVSPQAEAGLADDRSWGVLKAGCVNRGEFRETEHKRLPEGFSIDPRTVVHEGDVLVSRASGSPKLVGSVGRVDSLRYRLILSDKTFRLNIRDQGTTPFLVAVMNAHYFRVQVEKAISGAEGLANNLPLSALKDFWLAVPPSTEASLIADHLRAETQQLAAAIDRARRESDLLREYRTRLIADVVTGKLDARGVALPELDEADVLDDMATGEDAEVDEMNDSEEATDA